MSSLEWQQMASRLRELVGDRQQKAIAARAGVSESMLSLYLSGDRRPKVEKLASLMQAVGASADYVLGLADGANDQTRSFDLDEPDGQIREYLQVPLMASEVCAGPGAEMTEEIEGWHALRLDWVAGHVRNKPVRVRVARSHVGESMANTILPGAILTVDLGPIEKLKPGSIYLVRTEDGGISVKRVYPLRRKGTFLCMSDNRAFPPFELDERLGGAVLGSVLRWEQGENDW